MEIILDLFIGSIVGFVFGYKVASWGAQIREQEWERLFAEQAKLHNRLVKITRGET